MTATVKKAVNWALRSLGKRNRVLNEQASPQRAGSGLGHPPGAVQIAADARASDQCKVQGNSDFLKPPLTALLEALSPFNPRIYLSIDDRRNGLALYCV
jgi:hypothetical protein